MRKKNTTTEKVYWIAWGDVVHFGTLEPNDELWTGQPNYEQFAVESEWISRCLELGVNPIPEVVQEPQVVIPTPPTIEQRLDNIEAITAEIIVNLNEKGIVP